MGLSAAQIAANERKELKNIIGSEFDMVHNELNAQARIMKQQREKEIRAEYAEQVKRAQAAVAKLKKLANDFREKADTIVNELRASGVVPGSEYSLARGRGYDSVSPYTVEITEEWTPKSLASDIQQANQEIDSKLQLTYVALEQRKLQTLKELAITGLVSEDARAFLTQIPKAEDFIRVLETTTVDAYALNQ